MKAAESVLCWLSPLGSQSQPQGAPGPFFQRNFATGATRDHQPLCGGEFLAYLTYPYPVTPGPPPDTHPTRTTPDPTHPDPTPPPTPPKHPPEGFRLINKVPTPTSARGVSAHNQVLTPTSAQPSILQAWVGGQNAGG